MFEEIVCSKCHQPRRVLAKSKRAEALVCGECWDWEKDCP